MRSDMERVNVSQDLMVEFAEMLETWAKSRDITPAQTYVMCSVWTDTLRDIARLKELVSTFGADVGASTEETTAH